MADNLLKSKAALRKEVLESLKIYPKDKLLQDSDSVLAAIEKMPEFLSASHIFIFNSMAIEVQTLPLIKRWERIKHFYMPVVVDDKIVFRELQPDTVFTKNKLQIDEPGGTDFTDYDRVDLVIVPGVAFDINLNRMGHGKGYYDRFLPKVGNAVKAGICFEIQLFDIIPSDSNDVMMDFVVTEKQIISHKHQYARKMKKGF